jgi:serine-type D-Ala-D-Ala carboxypeptidase (penicillin-binding protein 5/6)
VASLSLVSCLAHASALPAISSPQWTLQHWSPEGLAKPLASQSDDVPTHPASITKLLTAYVVMQAVSKGEITLNTKLTVSTVAAEQDGTRVGYRAGERVAVQDAMQGMLAISGNDAAWCLAQAVGGGTVDGFVLRMNTVSSALGLRQSHWLNPHGLTQDGHVSTATDLARLAHALWRDFPQARTWLGVKTYTWHGVTQSNRNSLLWHDATVDGLKTGHTDAAGYNLAATSHWRMMVEQDAYDWRLTSVILGAASTTARAKDSADLLAWGRQHYQPWRLYASRAALGSVALAGALHPTPVRTADAVWLVLPKAQALTDLRYVLLPLPQAAAPVTAGTVIATLEVYQGKTLLLSHPALAMQAIERAPWYARLWQWVKSVFYMR